MKRLPLSDEQAREWHAGTLSVVRRRISSNLLDRYYDYDDWCNSVAPRDIPCSREYEKQFFASRAPYRPGEIVFIGEAWMGTPDCLSYKISDPRQVIEFGYDSWRSPITMPAWASRSKARIMSVTPEQEAGAWTWVIGVGRV